MRFSYATVALVAGLMVGLAGCEEQRPPQHLDTRMFEDDVEEPEQVRLTLDEMLEGTWERQRLAGHPLTMELPPGWAVDYIGETAHVRGPTPAGPPPDGIRVIFLNQRADAYSPFILETLRERMAREQDERVKLMEFRELGEARVMESRQVLETDPERLSWSVTVYAPSGEYYIAYSLRFIDMSLESYEADLPILERMVGSLRYEPAAVPSRP